MCTVPPGSAYAHVPPVITSYYPSRPSVILPAMPSPPIQGAIYVGRQRQHPVYAPQQVLQLDSGPSQPHRRFYNEPPVPSYPVQSKGRSTTSDWHDGYERSHNTRVVFMAEASHVATHSSHCSRSGGTNYHSYPAHETPELEHRHEHDHHDEAHRQSHPPQSAPRHQPVQRDERGAHEHDGHPHAHEHPHHSHRDMNYDHSSQSSHHYHHHDDLTLTHHDDHHDHEDLTSGYKLGASYRPTPPPSESSSCSRSSIEVTEPNRRFPSVPQHRTLYPGPSAMKRDPKWGRRQRRGPVHFLVGSGSEDVAGDGQGTTHNRGNRFDQWSWGGWLGWRNKSRE